MIQRTALFLLLNFGALAFGSYYSADGVPSEWYVTLIKAPWTPPGWVFGFAWTTIMICFSLFMAYLWPVIDDKKFIGGLYGIQWILNAAWSPAFFYLHEVTLGLIIISLLTILMGYFLFKFRSSMRLRSAFVLPYFIWLLLATSLNGYILIFN